MDEKLLAASGGFLAGIAALITAFAKFTPLFKRKTDPDLSCIIRNNDFFAHSLRAIRYDIPQMFDVAKKKDAQFYMLMLCRVSIFNNKLKSLSRDILSGRIREIEISHITSLHFDSVAEYTDLFMRFGGREIVVKKFNAQYQNHEEQMLEMMRQFLSCSAFSDPLMRLVAILSIYNLMFFSLIDDLCETYRLLNGEVDKACTEWECAEAISNLKKEVIFDESIIAG